MDDKVIGETYLQVLDVYERVILEVRDLAGQKLSVSYIWEDASYRCTNAKAMLENTFLAEAKFIEVCNNENEKDCIVVEETHYEFGGSGEVTYKCRSTFELSHYAKKTGERPLLGKKTYEVFLHWGEFH